MPVSYCIEGDIVIIRPVGANSTVELRATWLAAERDPEFPPPPHQRVCVDVRESESLAKRSIDDMRQTADWFIERAAQSPDRVCAFVTRPGVQYGLMRMLSIWLELKGFRSHVTTDADDAIHWLRSLEPAAAQGPDPGR